MMTGAMLVVAGLVPGLPFFPFFAAGALSAGGGYFLHKRAAVAVSAAANEDRPKIPAGKLDAALPERNGRRAGPPETKPPSRPSRHIKTC